MSRPVKRGAFARTCGCGWSGTYATVRTADYAVRQHSCDRWRRLTQTHARGDQRRERWAQLDRTPKPCLHPRANHQHGHYATYTLDGCRCRPCCEATTTYEQNRVRRNAYGRTNFIDANPARAHVRALMDQGMGLRRIAARSGVSHGGLSKLIYQSSKRVRRDVADKVLALDLELADGAVLPLEQTTGIVLRLRALVALGWSMSKLADRIEALPTNLAPLISGQRPCTAGRARVVTALYDELSMVLPPATNQRERISVSRSRRYARDRGWLPPLALDDERLDDPTYAPQIQALQRESDIDEAAVLRRVDGDRSVDLTRAERLEVVRRLNGLGFTDWQISERTGIHRDQAQRDRKDMGIRPVGRWAS